MKRILPIKIYCIFACSLFLLTLFSPPSIYSAELTLAWDANTESDLTGYYIYYKTGSSGPPYNGTGSVEGNSPIQVPKATLNNSQNPEYTIHGLSDTEKIYFVLTAYDTNGNQSGYSNEVFYQSSSAPTLTSLSISGGNSVNESSSASYTATATFSDRSTQTVTGSANWSEDSSYATINSNGVITASEVESDVTITIQASYTYEGVTKTATKVATIIDISESNLLPNTPITLISLSISGDDFVNGDSSAGYAATATFSNGSTQTVSGSANWSEDSSYASIDSSGVLTTSEVSGDVTMIIQASYTYEEVTETANKVVTIIDVTDPVTLSSLSISGDDVVNENSHANYATTAFFSNGSTQTVSGSASWSEDSSYASIDSNGVLTTSEVPGDVTVTIQASCTYNEVTKTANKVVTIINFTAPAPAPAPAPVTVTLGSLSISGDNSVNENSSAGYTATAFFSDGSTQTVTGSANWFENSSYTTINSSGVLTTSEVPGDVTVTIQASYIYEGVTRTTTKRATIIDVSTSNLPPDTPSIVYPEDGQYDVEMPLDIITQPFSDSDNDAHSKSQWQISEQSDFSTLVVDITSDNYLTTFPVPHMVLESERKYYVRVRFYDFYDTASDWSNPVEFTTTYFVEDLNSNGIPDANEVDDTVDLNLDGIPDNDQPEIIKCVQAVDGSVDIGVEKTSDAISQIQALEMIDPDTIPDTANRPDDFIFGLASYRLLVNPPGATVTVRIYFSGEIFDTDNFFKYDTINGWYDYSDHTTLNDDGQSVTVELKDGGYGDSDGLANGIIADPGGIASEATEASTTTVSTSTTTVSSGSGGGGGRGCFIATAAYGSKFEKHVQLLRRFRDLYLMPYKIGRTFVSAYYRYSPPVADFIANQDILRMIVRCTLLPLVGLSWMLLHLGVAPALLLLILMSSATFFYYRKLKLRS
jgi:hypothetical protein